MVRGVRFNAGGTVEGRVGQTIVHVKLIQNGSSDVIRFQVDTSTRHFLSCLTYKLLPPLDRFLALGLDHGPLQLSLTIVDALS